MASQSTERLILEVEKFPQLYDVSLEAYKDTVKKQDIWETIGARLDMPGKEGRHFKAFSLVIRDVVHPSC